MNKPSNLAMNLKKIRIDRHLSLTELSRELGIPKSTLQSVLTDGNTSLDTALRISNSLRIPLDALTSSELSPQQSKLLERFLTVLNWYHDFSPEDQREFDVHLAALLRIIGKHCNA